LRAQTRSPDEFVIVDDASTDQSLRVIQELSAGWSIVRVLANRRTRERSPRSASAPAREDTSLGRTLVGAVCRLPLGSSGRLMLLGSLRLRFGR
jgi:hypothetical protein